MAIETTVEIDGRSVKFHASAALPRFYRIKFGRDIIHDMVELKKHFEKAKFAAGEDATDEEKKEAQLSALDLTMFENIAYTMAKSADKNVPSDPGEWLDQFETFSIYKIFPQIMEAMDANMVTTAVPKNA